jgi:CO/xanthine dehydrogenase Mo-binding subunit
MKTPSDQKQETNLLIPPAILAEGYHGKILLVSVSSAAITKKVILRSGDVWHREILRNTQNEILNLGITDAQVHQLGGAWVRFEPEGTIIIYGRSQEFGACDKAYAAELVRDLYPQRRVEVRN